AHGFSCSRRLSPLSGRNSTYRLVQISATGSVIAIDIGTDFFVVGTVWRLTMRMPSKTNTSTIAIIEKNSESFPRLRTALPANVLAIPPSLLNIDATPTPRDRHSV